jgi:DNA polymerase-3 subunit alpha
LAKVSGQKDFFGLDMISHSSQMVHQEDWPKLQRLQNEKEVLGFYLSGHPLENYAKELTHFISTPLAELNSKAGKPITIAGWVLSIRSLWTKRGDRMAVLNLEDASGRSEVTLFSDTFNKFREKLNKDKLLIIEGEIQRDEFTGNTRVLGKKILDISEARESHAKNLLIKLSKSANPSLLDDLRKIMINFCPGLCLARIVYTHPELKTQVYLTLGDNWRVKPEEDLLKALRERFGEESISIQY